MYRQRSEELTIFHEVRRLRQQVSFWKGWALWTAALLFVTLCYIVAFGVS